MRIMQTAIKKFKTMYEAREFYENLEDKTQYRIRKVYRGKYKDKRVYVVVKV